MIEVDAPCEDWITESDTNNTELWVVFCDGSLEKRLGDGVGIGVGVGWDVDVCALAESCEVVAKELRDIDDACTGVTVEEPTDISRLDEAADGGA